MSAYSPIRLRRSTVLADARVGGRIPPLDAREIARIERDARAIARIERGVDDREARVGASTERAWPLWIPLALVPVGGLVGYGVAAAIGLGKIAKIVLVVAGGVTGGIAGAAGLSFLTAEKERRS